MRNAFIGGTLAGLVACVLIVAYILPRTRSVFITIEVGLLVGILIGWVAFVILYFFQPKVKPGSPEAALQESRKLAQHIQTLVVSMQQRRNADLTAHLQEIPRLLLSIISVIEQDDDKRDLASLFLERIVRPVDQWLTEYQRLAIRHVDPASSDIQVAEQRTSDIVGTLERMYDRIHTPDVSRLAILNDIVEELSLDRPL